MRKNRIIVVLIFLLSVACNNTKVKTAASETIRVKTGKVTTGEISIPVHANGLLVSSEELKLSFKTGGIIAEIHVREGDRVKKGDLLASLNLSEINAQAAQAKNGYEKALRDFGRAENLFRDSVATLEQKQNAATALSLAKSVNEIARFNLAHSIISAPDNGVILRQFVKAGELVSSGYPVFLFGSSGKYWKVKVWISDKDIVRINRGDSADIKFDAYHGAIFKAVVDQTGEISNPLTGTYEIELILQKTDTRLVSGFVATADIFPSAKKTFSLIPVEAIVEADGLQGYIFIVTASMSVQKIKIEIETLFGSGAAVTGIPDGITEVVTEGVAYLKNGMKVEVVK
jgi:membrane fusion protein, multidrug efflux system